MKRTILALFILISLAAQAQPPKVEAKQDTVYVLTKEDLQLVISIFRQNGLTLDGKPLGFDAILNLIQYLEKKQAIIPKKEQPK